MRCWIVIPLLFAQVIASPRSASADGLQGFTWQTTVRSATAYSRATTPVRAGIMSQRFEIKSGDCGHDPKEPSYSDCNMDRERVELVSKQGGRMGSEHWWAFSIFIPHDFVDVSPVRTVLAQVGQIGVPVVVADGKISKPPLLQFNIFHDSYLMTYHELIGLPRHAVEVSRDIPLAHLDEMRGRWTDVMLHVRFGDGDGFARVYVNGHEKGSIRRGLVRWPVTRFPLKYGIYRPFVSQYEQQYHKPMPTQVIYFDEIREGRTRAAVDLSSAEPPAPID